MMAEEPTIHYRPSTPRDGAAMLSIHIRAIELVAVLESAAE